MVIVNQSSGGGADAEELLSFAMQTFMRAGWSVEGESCAGAGLGAAFERAIRDRPDRLIVAGGDGTIRSAALAAMASGSSLGIISMGTMNLLAKDLSLPLDPWDAAEMMVTATEAAIDVGEVNGSIFLHSSLIGVFPLIGEERERARKIGTPRAYWESLRNAATSTWNARPMGFDIGANGSAEHVRTYGVIVSNNRLFGYPDAPFRRMRLDASELGMYVSRHAGRLGLFQMLAWIGLGWWRFDRGIEERVAPEVVIDARRPVRVMNDGEIEVARPPLRYRVMPKALRVLVRAAAAPEDGGESAG